MVRTICQCSAWSVTIWNMFLKSAPLATMFFSIQGADSQDQSKAWDLATLRSFGVRRLYQRKLLVAHFVLLMHRFSFRHLIAEVHQAGATIWWEWWGYSRVDSWALTHMCYWLCITMHDAESKTSANLVWHFATWTRALHCRMESLPSRSALHHQLSRTNGNGFCWMDP